ncbi:hypothetical protein [Polaribacter sp. Asnod1-A03]|uniref:hypothetical protein n=1 Tax=Polaribacter sp. Asnod1-A03 TaxID=3160581 RepID=UPI00386E556D
MRNFFSILAFIILFLSFSCNNDNSKPFVTISGVIKNSKDSVLTIVSGKVNKKIKVSPEGKFSDTLYVEKAKIYRMHLNNSQKGFVFLNNGYNLKLDGDANNFFYGFKYLGEGADSNNLLISQHNYSKNVGSPQDFIKLNREDYNIKVKKVTRDIDSINNLFKKADTVLINISNNNKDRFLTIIDQMYHQTYDFQ